MNIKSGIFLSTGLLFSAAVFADSSLETVEPSQTAPATANANPRTTEARPAGNHSGRAPSASVREQLRIRENQPAPDTGTGEWGSASRGGPSSVGPGCDYASLQAALDDAQAGNIPGNLGVRQDYQATGSYTISDLANTIGLWVMGGFPDCDVSDADSTAGRTTLDVQGSGRPVSISYGVNDTDPPRQVRLENLVLTGGDTQLGGGLRILGRPGLLTTVLVNTEVSGNQAATGGGIQIAANADWIVPDPENPPPPMLFLDDDSDVIGNVATGSGGGIWCGNNSETDFNLTLLRTGAGLILDNQAERGGGVFLSDCSFVLRNGGPILLFIPAGGVAFNTASIAGGGVYAENGASGSISALSHSDFGGDPQSAGLIFGNEAPEGGGIFATGEDTMVFGIQSFVVSNTATGSAGRGGGILADQQALVHFISSPGSGACSPRTTSSGVTTSPPCNRLENNHAQNRGGGAMARSGGEVRLNRTFVTGNTADSNFGAVVTAIGSSARAEFTNSLIANNGNGSNIIHADSYSEVVVRWSTVADNIVEGSNSVFRAFNNSSQDTTLSILSSIVWGHSDQNMVDTAGTGDVTATADCVIGYRAAADTDLTNVSFYSQIDPQFRDPAEQDYRLGPTSPAIDYCDGFSSPPGRDLDDRIRGTEYTGPTTEAPNPVPGGIYDLGAFVGVLDSLFQDRFQ